MTTMTQSAATRSLRRQTAPIAALALAVLVAIVTTTAYAQAPATQAPAHAACCAVLRTAVHATGCAAG